MGALTHNGDVITGLPSTASQINYDNTSSGMAATQVQAAIDELSSGLNGVTANDIDISGYDDITATTLETAYVCPSDGYLYASSETDTTGTIRVVVLGAVSLTPIGFIYMNVSGEYQIQTLLLRKGMKIYVPNRTANAVVRFNKLGW